MADQRPIKTIPEMSPKTTFQDDDLIISYDDALELEQKATFGTLKNEIAAKAPVVSTVASIADLYGLVGVAGQQISVKGYHPDTTVGGSTFAWGSGVHNGSTFIDPSRTFPTPAEWAAGSSDPAVIAWFDTSGGTVSVWQRLGGSKTWNFNLAAEAKNAPWVAPSDICFVRKKETSVSDNVVSITYKARNTGTFTDTVGGEYEDVTYLDVIGGLSCQLQLMPILDALIVDHAGAVPDSDKSTLSYGRNNAPVFNKLIECADNRRISKVMMVGGRLFNSQYGVSEEINMRVGVKLSGVTMNQTILRMPSFNGDIIAGKFVSPGVDYIYLESMTIDADGNGSFSSGHGINFERVYVNSYIRDVVVLNQPQANIRLYDLTVVMLDNVWSNLSNQECISIDSCRSITFNGGAYEYPRNANFAHIKIRNSLNYDYPVISLSGSVHIEGLVEANQVGIDINGGSTGTSYVLLNLNGIQVLGRAGSPSGNYALNIAGNRVAVNINGFGQTGCNKIINDTTGLLEPDASVRFVNKWERTQPTGATDSTTPDNIGQISDTRYKIIKVGRVSVTAFTVTESTISIPTQTNTDYDVSVTAQGFLGNNISYYPDYSSKTTTSFKIKFANITSGAASQLSNNTDFMYEVRRKL